CLQGTHLPFTF
nr:immunoglobulin light chain junction region [Macaca mulatta]MOV37170.1 immunoglobulin light chain junction region [Macaca mulatta]MOV37528.1 immunoglobulin light chain junction region [Macaca mulatta]MOV37532.1 immunoglobulin light chain junction region [Macaca mulatta]MOV37637.1 immunoglobulin light chain junction region [Macaca mulatta]